MDDEEKIKKELLKEIKAENKIKNLNPEGMYFFKPSLHIDNDKAHIYVSISIPFPRISSKGIPILDTQTMVITKYDSFILNEDSITQKHIFPINIPSLSLPARWEMTDIQDFLNTINIINSEESVISVRGRQLDLFDFDTFGYIKTALDYFFELSDPAEYFLYPVFIMTGYLLPIFNAVPFINLTGTRGGGKTKMIEFFYQLACNAESTSSTSPSALFRIIEQNSSVVLLDESEKLTGLEKDPDIRLLLNACYRKSGKVTRTNKDTHKPERFNVFAMCVIAAQNSLEPTLLSRCISRVMIKTAGEKGKRDVTDKSWDWQKIRNRLYRFIFNAAEKVEKIYLEEDFGNLNCRNLDIWKPLLSVAKYLDSCSGKTEIFDNLKKMAEEQEEDQDVLTYVEELTLGVLVDEVKIDDKYWSKDFLSFIKDKAVEEGTIDSLEKVNSKTIAAILRKFGLHSIKKERTNKGIPYRINPDQVKDLCKRYIANLQSNTPITSITQNEAKQKDDKKSAEELWNIDQPL